MDCGSLPCHHAKFAFNISFVCTMLIRQPAIDITPRSLIIYLLYCLSPLLHHPHDPQKKKKKLLIVSPFMDVLGSSVLFLAVCKEPNNTLASPGFTLNLCTPIIHFLHRLLHVGNNFLSFISKQIVQYSNGKRH